MKNIKRQMAVLTVIGLMFGNVAMASAQTTSTTALQALIQSLQKQIESLTAQLQVLQQAQTQVQSATTTTSVTDALQLVGQLRLGSSGERVRLLQAILAADSDVYPEGVISGYYGKLTEQAVKRFQKMHELEQVGNVGKKTLEEIDKELEQHPIGLEERDGERVPCAIVPPGHLIAPGWLRKNDGEAPVVPQCQNLPKGIEQNRDNEQEGEDNEGDHATSSVDMIAPVISGLMATNVTASSSSIVWTTNEDATSNLWYSISTPVATTGAPMVTATTLVTNHIVPVSGLATSTTYYYVVSSADDMGNVATSTEMSFQTSAN